MADQLTPGPQHRETEFWRDPATGVWLTGTCGPCALAMAAWNATGRETHTLDVYHLMRAHGLCDVSGASTPGALKTAASLLGLNVIDYMGYGGDDWSGWPAFLGRHAGKAVIVLELSNGQALHDEISGKGENASNLRYHYICGYGPQGDGWAFADGDNWAVGDVLQRYSLTTLSAAKPCAALAILVPDGGSMANNIPSGWHDDGHTLTAPNGHTVTLGFRQFVLDAAGWNPNNQPLNEAYGTDKAGSTRQDFRDSALMYTPGRDVWSHPYGPDVIDLRSQLDAARQQVADLLVKLQSAGSGSGASADPTATALVAALQAALAAHKSS